jgi:hypothetical protein
VRHLGAVGGRAVEVLHVLGGGGLWLVRVRVRVEVLHVLGGGGLAQGTAYPSE